MTKVLSITDDTDTCECCGKTNLKRVVVLDIDGSIVRYGVNCAARATQMKKTYTAKTAARFVSDFNAREDARQKFEQVKQAARNEATRMGCNVLVCHRDKSYYTVREPAYDADPSRYGSIVFTATAA